MNRVSLELCHCHAVSDAQALRRAAYEAILAGSALPIHGRGQFHLLLAGGDMPRGTCHELCAAQTDWSAWHIYFDDERCLPPVDSACNTALDSERSE